MTGPRRGFTAEAAALRTLRSELDQWQRDAAGGTVRASFRLVEPSADELTEPVTVVPADPGAVAPTDEPGLHVDAGQVWRGGGVTVAGDHPQEILLAELGRASRLWPELDEALRTARPEGLELDTEGAHRFLREGAPTLHAAGFTVLLPSWSGPLPQRARRGDRPGRPGRT